MSNIPFELVQLSAHFRQIYDLPVGLLVADSLSRAVAAGNRGRKWNPGQNQVCDVGSVFPCGPLGVLWPQPDLLRHSGRKWREERAKYGSSCQFQAPKVAVEIDRRASGAGSDRARVPRSASRVPGCRTGNTSRRTRRTPLDGLRFQQPGLRHPTFLLLASGRPPHRYKVGGFGSVAADAPWAQRWPSGVEITEPLQSARGLRLTNALLSHPFTHFCSSTVTT